MRRSAVIDTARGLSLHDHVGWSFHDPADFRAHAGRFLAEGLDRRQRIIYIAGADETVPDDLAGLRGAQVEITSVAQMYTAGEPVDPEEQVATFAEAKDRALADGWTGLRVAADVTSLVLTDEQRAAWIRYEYLVDGFMSQEPVSGFCGFDRTALDPTALAEVACLHPALTPDTSEFRLFTAAGAGPGLTLAGEIDPGNRHILAAALDNARPVSRDGRFTVDATALTFIDHRGLELLADYAAQRGVDAVIYTGRDSVAAMISQVVSLSGLDVRVVAG
ncbi:MEDS domain-containing protein [Actinoplanes sp. OR16]|uniref:MEDS domain-containing protein n=1 Tax=Actinoplanes sp. OR16 TaxID=946334 RepID=UPI000FDBAC82|nr:MEDS domain-containing protein [Actinoplanes sp. OR16]